MGLEIEKRLQDAGFKMFGTADKIEELILEILETKNNRYLKAIPFLIYRYNIDTEKIHKKTTKKELFDEILAITKKIFLNQDIQSETKSYLLKEPEAEYNKEKYKLDYDEFKGEFEIQLRQEKKPDLFIDKQKINAERNLQMSLSQLFTKKEKYMIRRILDDKPISKTDYEYYSRKTKKKIKSIISLQEFAKNIYDKSPKYDEKLFFLKKELEKWLKDKWKLEGDIAEYKILDDKIIISHKDITGETSINSFKLQYIKDKKILKLFEIYPANSYT